MSVWHRFVKDNYDRVRSYANRDRFRILGRMYKKNRRGKAIGEKLIPTDERPGCAPTGKNSGTPLPCTCLSKKVMLRIAEDINRTHGDLVGRSADTKQLLSTRGPELIPNAAHLGETNPCRLFGLLKQHFGRERHPREWSHSTSRYYRPTKDPIAKDMLSTNDIRLILEQYATVYPEFVSYGAVPADFCTLDYTEEICGVSLRTMIKAGKRCAAVIINTDPSDRRGAHWISLWIDIRDGRAPTFIFWDSLGDSPPTLIKNTMNRLYKEATQMYRTHELDRPPRELLYPVKKKRPHQKGGVDCGVFCVYIIIYLLSGGNPSLLNSSDQSPINDQRMRDYFMHIYPTE